MAQKVNKSQPKAQPWEHGLLRSKDGRPKRNLANVLRVMLQHPDWDGVLAYDQFAEAVVTLAPPPMRDIDRPARYRLGTWSETDATRTAAWFAEEVGIDTSIDMVMTAVQAAAEKQQFHPIQTYLRSLKWDGTPRVEAWLPRYMHAPDTEYSRAVGARWLISAVARVFAPGCKADCLLVVRGKQGRGKSTAFGVLGGEYFVDSGIQIGDKDSFQILRRSWIYEFGEFASIRGREVERVKAFVSSQQDTYRPSYGRQTRTFPRQTVFCATLNDEDGYLADPTGNRRFWPVDCLAPVDVEGLRRDRDQLWAEAVRLYQEGHPWHVDSAELAELCAEEQAAAEVTDDWVTLVARWLDDPTVPTPGSVGERDRLDLAKGVTTAEVLRGALELRPNEMGRAATTRVGTVLRKLGFEARQLRERGERVRRYYPVTTEVESDQPQRVNGWDNEAAPEQPDSQPSQPSQPNLYTHTREGAR